MSAIVRGRIEVKPWLYAGMTMLALAAAVVHASEAPGRFFVHDTTPLAFQQPVADLDDATLQQFTRGRALFNQFWVASPSLDPALDGLGPTFNQSSCAACHLRNGRGKAPSGPNERLRGLLVRLSVRLPDGTTAPHPAYGDQLQESAVLGVPAEGRAIVQWQEQTRVLVDGAQVSLRKPIIKLTSLKFGEADHLLLSPRLAPQLIGLGLLDAVPAEVLEQLVATPRPDGISGRVNRIPDGNGGFGVGRFGWRANSSDLLQQTANAFSGDLGITSTVHPAENCPSVQEVCAALPFASPDLTDEQLASIVLYQSALAVPAPRDQDAAAVVQGRLLFEQAGCQHCHVPELVSGNEAALPVFANQRFEAYTDLLLHDMGEGLADGRPDFEANEREWRTPPLWGLGLIPVVNEHRELLHDGRARNVLEAILWHDGEAATAAARVSAMSADERTALEAFVLSL